jgi:hypothetical protein
MYQNVIKSYKMVQKFKKPRLNATVRETKCVHCGSKLKC